MVAGDLTVKITGVSAGKSEPGAYLKVEHTGREGDVITAALRMRLQTMHDDPNWNAILHGPLELAGMLARKTMPVTAPQVAKDPLQFRSVLDPDLPSLTVAVQA